MKALVTGSSGFLGTHLVRRLVKEGITVVPFERLWWFGMEFDELTKKIQEINPDYIFHLAAFGNHHHQQDEQQIFMVNVFNIFQLLEATKNIPYKGFFYFGSSSEYGSKNKAMKEEDLVEAKTFYGVTKACGTLLSQAFCQQFDKSITIIRPFSVYGPGEADFRLIPSIIRSLRFGDILPLTNGMHDWIYIDDFIDGVIKVLENKKKLKGEIINIGTGQQFSNKEVVKTLERITGYPVNLQISDKEKRDYDSSCWMADNHLLQLLGWEQQYSLEEGLKKTYESIKKENTRN